MIDEADAIFGGRQAEKYEGVRAVLNSGNRKGTPVLRVQWVNRRREVERLDVFGAKAIAGIGNLPDTVSDRSIPIRMRRRASYEPVARWREREIPAIARAIGRPINPFGTDGTDGTGVGVRDLPEVDLPEELNDRAQDAWETLLIMATLAGGDWPERTERAAISLNGEDTPGMTNGVRLLADIRTVFESSGSDYMPAATLLDGLYRQEDSPWTEWYGRPLTSKGLANLLNAYSITSHKKRIGTDQKHYYFKSDFEDSWSRYIPLSQSPYSNVPRELEASTPTLGSVPSVPSVPNDNVPTGNALSSVPVNGLLKCSACGAFDSRSALIRDRFTGILTHRYECVQVAA